MSSTPTSNGPLPLPDLLSTTAAALDAVARLAEAAERGVAALVAPGGRVDAAALDRHQVAAHGFAWVATYAEALRQMQGWAERLDCAGRLGELEACMLQAAFGEYLAQLDGGLAMSQGEIVRPADFGLDDEIGRAHV